jgi:hypothetical protein
MGWPVRTHKEKKKTNRKKGKCMKTNGVDIIILYIRIKNERF